MFDSGAKTDMLSPDFVRACQVLLLELPSPLVLQMGTKGSRLCIYYGTNVDLKVLDQQAKHYFDIVNINRYDAILGTLWLNHYGAMLDCKEHVMRIGEMELPTMDVLTEKYTIATGASAHCRHHGVVPSKGRATVTSDRK